MNLPSPAERRQRQRFAALREGKPCIEIQIGDARGTLIDLSLDGFGLPASLPLPSAPFDFVLRLIDGFGDKVRGRAELVSLTGEGSQRQQGCRFIELDAAGAQTLKEWLVVIVICSASVRLSSREAEAIVQGPSLI